MSFINEPGAGHGGGGGTAPEKDVEERNTGACWEKMEASDWQAARNYHLEGKLGERSLMLPPGGGQAWMYGLEDGSREISGYTDLLGKSMWDCRGYGKMTGAEMFQGSEQWLLQLMEEMTQGVILVMCKDL